MKESRENAPTALQEGTLRLQELTIKLYNKYALNTFVIVGTKDGHWAYTTNIKLGSPEEVKKVHDIMKLFLDKAASDRTIDEITGGDVAEGLDQTQRALKELEDKDE